MNKTVKSALGLFLAAVLLLALLPGSVLAVDSSIIASGSCGYSGENLTWTLTGSGLLTVSGTGNLVSSDGGDTQPWAAVRTKIKTAVLSEGVESIGSYAFAGCVNLKSVSLPDTLRSIYGCVFWNCGKLESVTIPASVEYILPEAFCGSSGMKSIAVDAGNRGYASRDGALFLKSMEVLLARPAGKTEGHYEIPSGVTTVWDFAFYGNTNLHSLTFPLSVKQVRPGSFNGCSVTDVYYVGTWAQWERVEFEVHDAESDIPRDYPFDNAEIHYESTGPLSVPELKSASAGDNGITVVWNAVSGATKYRVYRKTGSGGWIGLADVTLTRYTDAAVTVGTTYTYTVKAYNDDAWSSFDPKGVSATARAVFGAPVLKGAAAGTNGITVTWNAVSGATTYRVYRKTDSGSWTGLAEVTGTSFLDTAVAEGTVCTYTVRAFDGSAWSSFDAKGVSATAQAVFGAPVLKGASAGANGITVTWNAVSGATTYRVYRKTGTGGWTGLKDVTGTSYTDAAVTAGTAYTYTVKAYNGTSWSGFDTKGVTATAQAVFSAPVLTEISGKTSYIRIAWSAVAGATKYRVYRKTGSEGWIGLEDVTDTVYADYGPFTVGTTYTYTVRAYNGASWSGFDASGLSYTIPAPVTSDS